MTEPFDVRDPAALDALEALANAAKTGLLADSRFHAAAHEAVPALIARIGELERDRDDFAAQIARLFGVPVDLLTGI